MKITESIRRDHHELLKTFIGQRIHDPAERDDILEDNF